MAIPRSQQIDLSATPYYHCISRCVRRSFICGVDSLTGKDYTHRRGWIAERIKFLSDIFAINICSYVVMSNHFHIVLHVNEPLAKSWSDDEVKARWTRLHPSKTCLISNLEGSPAGEDKLHETIEDWRKNLTDISWFMRRLNEHISRMANAEDKCKGRFWEGRFKSQSLLDEAAVLSAMAYVDLNPIRAGIAKTPEESVFTSIHERIKTVSKQIKTSKTKPISAKKIAAICDSKAQPDRLMEFANQDNQNNELKPVIDFRLSDYIQLVDATGKVIRDDKRGAIPNHLAPILERLQVSKDGWVDMVKGLEKNFSYAVGSEQKLSLFNPGSRNRGIKGITAAKRYYHTEAA